MTVSRIAPWRWLAALFALAVGLGGLLGVASSVSRGASLGALALMALATAGLTALGVWLAVMYWRRLDEAAREAHKWSWFWGGNIALIPLLVGFFVLVERPEFGAPLWPGLEATPGNYVVTGGLAVAFALMAGYGVAWLYWWLWKSR